MRHMVGCKLMEDEQESISSVIKQAITAPDGQLRLANAERYIIKELERNRFNTQRAIEIYTFAIDNSVWASLKGQASGRLIYQKYRQSGLGGKFAIELTEKFKKRAGVLVTLEDQRPPRRFLRFLLDA
jgi:hypothetical protein